ncbi:hypothetical protein BH23ACI1_BH23ACI1_04860 [soil metagenome]
MRKLAIVTAVLVAAVLVFLLATLPPQPVAARWSGDPSIPARTVGGAYHVHTTRSDGAAGRAAVAAAAARAGLQFVIFTEHGDGMTAPEPPAYLSGVLCLDGVEISTNGGHYTAIDLPQTPYPLGGEASAVVEDVRRFGGFGFIAHPDSPRSELAWNDWTLSFDGVEWMNADSAWRNEPRPRMLRVLFDYMLRPGPALASLLDRPVMTLTRWDALTTRRPVVAIAGHDAHGGFGVGAEGGGWWGVPLPSYEASFKTFSTRVLLDSPWVGDAAADGRVLVDAIRAGRVHTVIDAVATPGYLLWRREAEDTLVAEASLPPGGELVVLHAEGPVIGREVLRSADPRQVVKGKLRGAYRVEVRVPWGPGEPPIPWLVSNPIYFLPATNSMAASSGPRELLNWPSPPAWHAEHDPTTRSTMTEADDRVTLAFELGGGEPRSQFAAIAADLPRGMPSFDSVSFEATASRPMRVSVQLRYPEGDHRWGHSVYLDSDTQPLTLRVDDLLPLEDQSTRAPDPAAARSILFVVDLVNARPDDQGRFEIRNLAVGLTR